MRVIINGEKKNVYHSKLSEMVGELKINPDIIVIELNQRIIKKTEWNMALLKEDDRIEIISFVGGG